MNKVTTVNLAGNAYQLEESGYDTLRAYLEAAAAALAGNPDRDEIVADIEQAIAEKFRATLGGYKTVVATKEVERIVAEMGPVEGDRGAGAASTPAGGSFVPPPPPSSGPVPPHKRLYIVHEGAMLGGVCNGIAAYAGIDVTIVRVLFVLITLAYGTGAVVYLLLLFLLPAANTPDEKAAATGLPRTAQEFIRRAKAGYYEGMKGFGDRRAHREWRRKFKQDMRGWSRDLKREMRDNAQQWQTNWHSYWANHPRFSGAPSFALPILSLLSIAAVILLFLGFLSLVTKGVILGIAPPHGMPLWVAILLLIIVYHVVVWPLKAARHACTRRHYWGPFWAGHTGPFESLAWLALLVLLLLFLNHRSPEVHAALHNLGPQLHHASDRIRAWWNGA